MEIFHKYVLHVENCLRTVCTKITNKMRGKLVQEERYCIFRELLLFCLLNVLYIISSSD